VSKLDISDTAPDRNTNGLYAQYLDHRWVNIAKAQTPLKTPRGFIAARIGSIPLSYGYRV
jgi:hypothetical protein